MTVVDPYLTGRCADIEIAIVNAGAWHPIDPRLSAYLGGYLCVVASGVFEDCIEFVICKRAGRGSDTALEAYVRSLVDQTFRNPDSAKIRDVLKRFDPGYRARFDARVANDAVAALNSIVNIKNGLAHGTSGVLPVNVTEATDYIRRSIPILEALEDILH